MNTNKGLKLFNTNGQPIESELTLSNFGAGYNKGALVMLTKKTYAEAGGVLRALDNQGLPRAVPTITSTSVENWSVNDNFGYENGLPSMAATRKKVYTLVASGSSGSYNLKEMFMTSATSPGASGAKILIIPSINSSQAGYHFNISAPNGGTGNLKMFEGVIWQYSNSLFLKGYAINESGTLQAVNIDSTTANGYQVTYTTLTTTNIYKANNGN